MLMRIKSCGDMVSICCEVLKSKVEFDKYWCSLFQPNGRPVERLNELPSWCPLRKQAVHLCDNGAKIRNYPALLCSMCTKMDDTQPCGMCEDGWIPNIKSKTTGEPVKVRCGCTGEEDL